jgi:hypothetical protein
MCLLWSSAHSLVAHSESELEGSMTPLLRISPIRTMPVSDSRNSAKSIFDNLFIFESQKDISAVFLGFLIKNFLILLRTISISIMNASFTDIVRLN